MPRRSYYYVVVPVEHTYSISGENNYVGKYFQLISLFDGNVVNSNWEITNGNQYATITNQNNKNYIYIEPGAINNNITVSSSYIYQNKSYTATKQIRVTYDNILSIESANTITGTEGNIIVKFNSLDVTQSSTIQIQEGSEYIQNGTINSDGSFTILNNGTITLVASYSGYTTRKNIELIYDNNSETTVINNEDGSVTTITTTTTTDGDDTIVETITITTNEDGSSTSTTSSTTTAQDGSSITTTETINSDGTSSETYSTTSAPNPENGEITTTSTTTYSDGTSSQSNTVTQSDGSYVGTTTNLDENGDPVSAENVEGDTNGNVSTQEITYDENGDPVITGYNIDTSGSGDGEKNFNEEGVNTEFKAFDVTDGFVLHIHFTMNFANQPAGQNENHHNILTMKRPTPEPWYGFQLRQSNNTKSIILGTQFATGANTNTTINPSNMVGNVGEYDIQIIYDPSAPTNKFVAKNLITGTNIYTSNNTFPDIAELEYLSVCIGCAQDANGNPFRYSNIDVSEFTLIKLSKLETPVITCDGEHVTITCETRGVDIYYRLNETGNYILYTSQLTINSTTTVEAYATLSSRTTETVKEICRYVPPTLYLPVITCDGRNVTITCSTQDSVIYYRLNESGNFVVYTTPIIINSDTIVEAYSTLGVQTSQTVSENCIYSLSLESPNIYCDGEYVSITSNEPSVTIWYMLDNSGTYLEYIDSFQINATTIVEAYVELNGQYSQHTIETCTYSPIVLESPVITCNGSEIRITCATQNATIIYRLDGGNWEEYSTQIQINSDTLCEAYSTIHGRISSVVTENCIYNPIHDYSLDYLTLRVLTPGDIVWKSYGTGSDKTIEYSINDEPWNQITATTSGINIPVNAGDVVRFRGNNNRYCEGNKANYSGFDGCTATYDVEGNIHSMLYGDNFIGNDNLTNTTYQFTQFFKQSGAVSAENLILPATTLKNYCYRALFSKASHLITPPVLPATTLSQGCYWYMFEECPMTDAPELLATTLVRECYGYMFTGCSSLNYIKCLATSGFDTYQCTQGWVNNVSRTGTFVKDVDTTWTTGGNGIPTNWVIQNNSLVSSPVISYDGFDTITITCETQGATIYYRLDRSGNYSTYSTPITINSDTYIETYSTLNGNTSRTNSETCMYVSNIPIEASNRDLKEWTYSGNKITTPYSVNQIDGHSGSYAKGTFNFETSFALRDAQPTYLWFQHADQSATIYVDNVQVDKHWGGYTAFFSDISNYVHSGTNNIKVAIKNNEGNNLAPASGDFNFNATLGNVKLLTSPCLPGTQYGYDGFHVTSIVTDARATINITTTVPNDSSVTVTIADSDGFNWTDTIISDGNEMTFTTTINNPHLWNGIIDPHLYTITMEISKDGNLYHRFERDYGLRYYEYVINQQVNGQTYTGFLLNGQPYLLRGVCMHDDKEGKANALNDSDYAEEFAIIQELNCNFIRLAHYPHPKEVYDWCDQLGIIVQTEAPCVNKLQSTMPTDYYTHLEGQYRDMVNQHYNHPCIMFWGLSNETTTDDRAFGETKIEGYTTLIKNLDSERLVGYVMSHSTDDPSGYYNDPSNVDWFGCNIYTGWYIDKTSNDPSSRINTRIQKTITEEGKALAYSEYGCGGTQHCHSDNFMDTTTRGNYERHDIEYQMWLHEGQLAAIRNYPQLMFTAEWQLFDIAVASRNEGYTVCLDGENATIDDNLRRLNNKGLVERDHVTKKDTFYLYKAEWNSTDLFIHICGKDYTKKDDRVIKCYTNYTGSELVLKDAGDNVLGRAPINDHIAEFQQRNFNPGEPIIVESDDGSLRDEFSFD